MTRTELKRVARQRRHRRVRKKVFGTADRPRLAVFRSNRHIYAQLIDDVGGRTMAAASDVKLQDEDRALTVPEGESLDKTALAKIVGKQLAERAREAGIERAVFDRGGRLYHGRVKALAEGAREGGLEI